MELDQLKRVLVVSEDLDFLHSACSTLRTAGIKTVHAITDDLAVLPFLNHSDAAVVALDLAMPRLSGSELLPRIREEHPDIPIIVITGAGEVDRAVECAKAGDFDYIVETVEDDRFVTSIREAVKNGGPQSAVGPALNGPQSPPDEPVRAFHGIVTKNRGVKAIFEYIESIAPSREPLLITGETGTGKELVARAVHDLSGCDGQFVAVNVAGLDDAMFSDTLFGHRRGAFTGADASREGLIARACGGTLFLDEIGDLEKRSQVRILRLLEEKRYYPLGSDAPVGTDARILCATHQCLPGLVLSGDMRKDLYYRLYAHHVHVPPLRSRMEDIPLLADRFLEDASTSLGKRKPTPPQELVKLLSAYDFPGNVRELRAMIFDAVTRHRSGVLSLVSFQKAIEDSRLARTIPAAEGILTAGEPPFKIMDRFPTLREAADYLVAEALRRSKNNMRTAALLLGITRDALKKRHSRRKRLAAN
jgi:DNA-binding NtrC family response regulator